MSGIPGSGKTHWIMKAKTDYARARNQEVGVSCWIVCSADAYFVSKGYGDYVFDPSKLGEAHGACLLKYEKALRIGVCDVLVVDNTNTTTEEMAPYVALAMAHGAEIEIVSVGCPAEIAAKRNTHGVPLRACQAMAQRFTNLTIPHFWTCHETFVDGEEL
jgi:hypothetical protein